MKVEGSGPFGARIYLFVLLVAIALSSAVIAQVPAQDDSPAELRQRVMELYQQRKYKEAIPLAEKLVVVKRAKGEEDPDTATSLNNLAALYRAVGDYAKAEPLYQRALEIRESPRPRSSRHRDKPNNLAGLYMTWVITPKPNRSISERSEITRKPLAPIIQTPPQASTIWRAVSVHGRLRQSRTALSASAQDHRESPRPRSPRHRHRP